jgi:peptide/nickel transport system substrate-binding protein
MSRFEAIGKLFHNAESITWTRRALLKRTAVLGLATPALAALLSACETDDDDEPEDDDTVDPVDEPDDDEPEEVDEPDDEDDEVDVDTDDEEPDEPEVDDEEEDDEVDDEVDDAEVTDDDGQEGGRLIVATIGEPPTLDQHQTTASLTAEIGYCIYETLFAYDEEWEPAPLLADSYEVSDDGTEYTIALREGVYFHNGDEMTSEDVVASIERWGGIGGVGQNIMEVTDTLEASDDYTIEWTLSEPWGTILVALSNNTQGCAIYPASVLEEAGDSPLSDYIGTGPYQLVEHVADVHYLLERFEDFSSRDGDPDGYTGGKYQYLDEIEFIPVPDEASRVSGAQAGDYHIIMEASNDQYDVLVDDENLRVEILPPAFWDVFFVNWESPIMSDENMRKAFQACLDHEAIMQGARGGGDFVELHPGFMLPPTPWVSEAGEEYYNINDIDLAAEYLEEAGYDGTPVRFLATQEYSVMYNASMIAVQNMEDAGFEVELDIVDWATVVERRDDPDAWDIFVTWHGFVPDPSQITFVGQMGEYAGWWTDEEAQEHTRDMLADPDIDARLAAWDEVQRRAYESVPCIKLGNASTIAVWSMDVGGYTELFQNGVPYWNLWLED